MDYAAAVDQIVRAIPDVVAIYLFGSRASHDDASDSDVDLALLAAGAIDPLRRWALQEELATLLHTDIDLVDLSRASTVMRAQVITSGRLLHEADTARLALFETTVLSDYARLNEERGDILDDIRSRGTIHG